MVFPPGHTLKYNNIDTFGVEINCSWHYKGEAVLDKPYTRKGSTRQVNEM